MAVDGAGASGPVARGVNWVLARPGDGTLTRTISDPGGIRRARARAAVEAEVARTTGHPGVLVPRQIDDVPEGARVVLDDPGGPTLASLDPLAGDLPRFLELARDLTGTLSALHVAGWVHRAIDPALMIVSEGGVRWTGLDRAIRRITGAEAVGDPIGLGLAMPYISPEQTGRMHRSVDQRSDLYSLGVVLYRLLTGVMPFGATDRLAWIHAHLARRPVPADELGDVPQVLSQMFERLLEKGAEDRYQTAAGLLADLDRAAKLLEDTGVIAPFALGEDDTSDRFRLPERLFGRKTEVARLEAALERAAGGTAQVLLIGGWSGIGKSALVGELVGPLAARRGYFASGKGDQLRRDVPLAPLAEACGELVRSVLTEPTERLDAWRSSMRSALGDSAGALVAVVPELGVLLGELPEPPELVPRQAHRRLSRQFQALVQVFATAAHPLVLFVDDLQWVDEATIEVIEELVASPAGLHLLVLGAYRDNEVGDEHPLRTTFARLEAAPVAVEHLALGPLSEAAVRDLVAEVVGEGPRTADLAALVFEKTGANPFFVGRFLRSLHADGLIVFDRAARAWTWDGAAIAAAGFTDNVVELMAGRIGRLEAASRRALVLGAAIAGTFPLDLAAVVLESSPEQVALDLLPAVEAGLVDLVGGDYPVFADDERELAFRFVHDGIKEAAYSLVAEAERPQLHLRLARLLEDRFGDDAERVFERVQHWGAAASVIAEPQDRHRALSAHLGAAERALSSGAFASAVSLAEAGVGLLDEATWEAEHPLAIALYTRLAEAAFGGGLADRATEAGEVVLSRARGPLDKVRIHELRIRQATSVTMQMGDAVNEMMQVVALLGIEIEPVTSMEEMGALLQSALGRIAPRSDEDLLATKALESPELEAAQRVMASSLPAAAMARPDLHLPVMVAGLNLALEQGMSAQASTPFAHLALVLASVGHYELAYRFGHLSTAIAERFPDDPVFDNLIVFPVFVQHWLEPVSRCAADLEANAWRCHEHGSMTNFGYTINSSYLHRYWAGEHLEVLLELADRWRAPILDAKQDIAWITISCFAQAARCLRGETEDPTSLSGDLYDSAVTVPFWIEQNVALGVLNDTVLTTTLCRLFGDPERGLELYESRREWCDHPSNHAYFRYVQMQVNRVLCLLAIADDLDEEARAARMAEVDEFRERLAGWVAINATNLGHTLALVDAERARVDGRDLEAQAGYDESIRLARLNGFQPQAADAAERAAHFYRSRGRQVIARAYAEEAIDGWLAWGATGLAEHVRHSFDEELSTAPTRSEATSIDVQAVLRASEALTGQVDLEQLLHDLVDTVREVAGADRVALALALDDDGVLRVESIAAADAATRVLQHEDVDSSTEVPPEILRYVNRTGETVILHDAARRGRFTEVPYIRETRPRSVLCTPLEHRGQRIGVVYLENHLVTHAFTSDRVRLLSALASQASIAVQNAKLVGDLKSHGDQLAAKNEQLTELDQLREEFLAKTSHELRTPLHGIIGLAQSMIDVGDCSEAQLHNLELVASSGRRLNNLINDILDLSTVKKRELELRLAPTSVREVAEDVVALAGAMVGAKPVEVRATVPDGTPAVVADRDRLEQILLNLVGNGVKFTDEGRVEVSVGPVVDGRIEVRVTDTGPGIPIEHQERIFEAFEQGSSEIVQRHGGTGLGLSVANELVGLHGGRLQVRSAPGQGSTFSFTLEAADIPAEQLAMTTSRRAAPVRPELLTVDTRLPAGDGSHVLIVDDEPVNLQILFNYLGRLGYRVTAATNGADALRMCEGGLNPDVVLLDVMMPGIDGFEVCRRLREASAANDLPVIMLTARSQIDDLVAGLQAGANDYVTKPFSSKEVSARLTTQLKLSDLHKAVGRFVPRLFLEVLGRESVADVQLGDAVQRDMTVMFSDIRAFTQLSRNMTPAENFAFINAYLGVMEPAIVERGGFVDKYIGDGIMALFERPADALSAGLAMQQALAGFNADRLAARKPPIRMGIGLHAGSLMLGTVGGKTRMDTTVISDAVNLASRMETLTKAFGSGLLVTKPTLDGAAVELASRRVDRVALRPGEAPVEVYEVYEGEADQIRYSRDATRETFEQAVTLFHDRAFDEAEQLFEVVVAMDNLDQAARTYQERCRAIKRQFTSL